VGARRPHEPAELTLRVRRHDDGALTFSTPTCPGWAFTARRPAQIGEAIARAWTEAAIAAYARWRGTLYDLAEHEDELPPEVLPAASPHPAEVPPADELAALRARDERQRARRVRHPRTHEPEAWVELGDGYWRSPSGRKYRPDAAVVASVRAARSR